MREVAAHRGDRAPLHEEDDRLEVRRARGFYDLYDAAAQLGILPARGGVGESVLLLLRGFGIRAS